MDENENEEYKESEENEINSVDYTEKLKQTALLASIFSKEINSLYISLLVAIEKCNKEKVISILNKGINPNSCIGRKGYRCMHYAATTGDIRIGHILKRYSCTIDCTNDDGETPLHLSIYHNHKEFSEFLIQSDANIEAKNNDDETPIFYASQTGNYKMVRLLLYYGAKSNIVNKYNMTPIEDSANDDTINEFNMGKDSNRLYNSENDPDSKLSQKLRQKIMSYLDLKSLLNMSATCYRWHCAMDHPSIWKKFNISRWQKSLNSINCIEKASSYQKKTKFEHNDSACNKGYDNGCLIINSAKHISRRRIHTS